MDPFVTGLGSLCEGRGSEMLGSGNNLSRGTVTLPSDMPPLPQCLPLEPITLGNPKYTRSGELRRVLGVPFGSTSEEHSFGGTHQKTTPPVATEELKHFKDSVQDTSRKARYVFFILLKLPFYILSFFEDCLNAIFLVFNAMTEL